MFSFARWGCEWVLYANSHDELVQFGEMQNVNVVLAQVTGSKLFALRPMSWPQYSKEHHNTVPYGVTRHGVRAGFRVICVAVQPASSSIQRSFRFPADVPRFVLLNEPLLGLLICPELTLHAWQRILEEASMAQARA
jgi:hypothetical protein